MAHAHSGSTTVSFFCSKCSAPLRLDPSLATPNKDVCKEIAELVYHSAAFENKDDVDKAGQTTEHFLEYTATHSHQIIGSKSNKTVHEDYELIGDLSSLSQDSDPLAHTIRVHTSLFDLISTNSEVDHPLCEDCSDILLNQRDQLYTECVEENRKYQELLDKMTSEQQSGENEALTQRLQQLEKENETLLKLISECETDCKKLDTEILVEQGKQHDIHAESDECHKEYHELKRRLNTLDEENKCAENQLKYITQQLDSLIKTNAFNWSFHIWHNNQFGTINNFRLGRLPNIPVDWNEVNTAWGQTALLLSALAVKIGLTFQRYKIIPFGNMSYMISLSEPNKELPLHWTGGFKIFKDTKFDQAMVAFLDCVSQFGETIENKQDGEKSWRLPYGMSQGKLFDNQGNSYSVKVQFNSEEQWTKALKYLLTNLRWGLTYVTTLDSRSS